MRKSHIMIVEDERIVAKDICNVLSEIGCSMFSIASSGAEVMRMLEEIVPDIILMDISLKGDMDGITLTGEINKKYDVPVVYLTANSDELTWKKAMETQHYGFLLKPFSKAELHAIIERTFKKVKEKSTTEV